MAVPKRRTSPSKRDQRRSHHALTAPAWESCPQCGETKMRHRACLKCGVYRGRQIVAARD